MRVLPVGVRIHDIEHGLNGPGAKTGGGSEDKAFCAKFLFDEARHLRPVMCLCVVEETIPVTLRFQRPFCDGSLPEEADCAQFLARGKPHDAAGAESDVVKSKLARVQAEPTE